MAASFDTIPHDRLVARIEAKVIDGRVLDLIRGWLKADILKGVERWTPVQGSPRRGEARLAYSLGPESKEARVDPRETAIPRGSGGRDRARHGEHRAGAWSVRPSVLVLNR